MIQDQPYPAIPRRGRRSRQQVVRTGAQYARYFLLGLALVSLFVGLNVSLAGRTAELAVSIHRAEEQCRELEWVNAERVSRIALETNMEQVQRFAREGGFAVAGNLVYVSPADSIGPDASPAALQRSTSTSSSAAAQDPAESSSIWNAVLQRIRDLIPSFRRPEHVASTR